MVLYILISIMILHFGGDLNYEINRNCQKS